MPAREHVDELLVEALRLGDDLRDIEAGLDVEGVREGAALQVEVEEGDAEGQLAPARQADAGLNRESGVTIVMVSSELEELRQSCDRIAIVSGGRIAGILPANASVEDLGELMLSQVK